MQERDNELGEDETKGQIVPEEQEPSYENLEQNAMKRLWRAANKLGLAEEMLQIEQAWANKDDKSLVTAFDIVDTAYVDFIDSLLEDMMSEDEERTIKVYRDLTRFKLPRDRTWRNSHWKRACQWRDYFAYARQQSDFPEATSPVRWIERKAGILATEGEQFWKFFQTEDNVSEMIRKGDYSSWLNQLDE